MVDTFAELPYGQKQDFIWSYVVLNRYICFNFLLPQILQRMHGSALLDPIDYQQDDGFFNCLKWTKTLLKILTYVLLSTLMTKALRWKR